MKFFLYEILARIFALYVGVGLGRDLWRGLVERKIEHLPTDWFDALVFPTIVAHRESAPIRYWVTVSLYVIGLVACLVVAIFGWWHPNT